MVPEFQLWWLTLAVPAGWGLVFTAAVVRHSWRTVVAATATIAAVEELLVWGPLQISHQTSAIVVIAAVVFGALLPSVWRAIETALSRPRTYVWAAGILGGWWVIKHPLEAAIYFNKAGGALLEFLKAAGAEQIAILVLTVIIMWWGLKLVWRHVIRRRA